MKPSLDLFFSFSRCQQGSAGFPGGSAVKNLPVMQEMQVQSLGQEDPLEEGMATIPVFLPGQSHGQRSLVPIVHGVEESVLGKACTLTRGQLAQWPHPL